MPALFKVYPGGYSSVGGVEHVRGRVDRGEDRETGPDVRSCRTLRAVGRTLVFTLSKVRAMKCSEQRRDAT